MNGLTVTLTQILAGVGVLLVLFWVWRAGSRRAKAAAEAARSGARLVSLVGRVLFNAGLIVAVQWVVSLTRVARGCCSPCSGCRRCSRPMRSPGP